MFKKWEAEFPDLAKEYKQMHERLLPENLEETLAKLEIKTPIGGRAASQAVLQELAKQLPQLIGGSADLSCSDLTLMKDFPIISSGNFAGRNVKYGVREFAMATINNGLALCDFFQPY